MIEKIGGARYYGSMIGRWLTPDPLADESPGSSSYVYTANNPLRYIDPDGRYWEDHRRQREQEEHDEMVRALEELDQELAWQNEIGENIHIDEYGQDKPIEENEEQNLPIYRYGIITGTAEISTSLGQKVEIEVENLNILGTTVRVIPKYPPGFPSQELILLPVQKHTFMFLNFGREPQTWQFRISTVSDAFSIFYQIRSTWVPGMPPNPLPPDPNFIMRKHVR